MVLILSKQVSDIELPGTRGLLVRTEIMLIRLRFCLGPHLIFANYLEPLSSVSFHCKLVRPSPWLIPIPACVSLGPYWNSSSEKSSSSPCNAPAARCSAEDEAPRHQQPLNEIWASIAVHGNAKEAGVKRHLLNSAFGYTFRFCDLIKAVEWHVREEDRRGWNCSGSGAEVSTEKWPLTMLGR